MTEVIRLRIPRAIHMGIILFLISTIPILGFQENNPIARKTSSLERPIPFDGLVLEFGLTVSRDNLTIPYVNWTCLYSINNESLYLVNVSINSVYLLLFGWQTETGQFLENGTSREIFIDMNLINGTLLPILFREYFDNTTQNYTPFSIIPQEVHLNENYSIYGYSFVPLGIYQANSKYFGELNLWKMEAKVSETNSDHNLTMLFAVDLGLLIRGSIDTITRLGPSSVRTYHMDLELVRTNAFEKYKNATTTNASSEIPFTLPPLPVPPKPNILLLWGVALLPILVVTIRFSTTRRISGGLD